MPGLGTRVPGSAASPLACAGLIGSIAAAFAVANGAFVVAAALVAIAAVFALVAASAVRPGFPAVFVPILDRWGEAAVFAGAAWYFGGRGDHLTAFAAYTAAFGGIAQSYTAARAEVVGVPVGEGPIGRRERAAVLAAGLVLGVPRAAIWPLAAITFATATWRFALLLRGLRHTR